MKVILTKEALTVQDVKHFLEKYNYHTQREVSIPKEQLKKLTKKELLCLIALDTMKMRSTSRSIENANCWATETKQTILKEYFHIKEVH